MAYLDEEGLRLQVVDGLGFLFSLAFVKSDVADVNALVWILYVQCSVGTYSCVACDRETKFESWL